MPRSFLGLSVELTSVTAYARDPRLLALARRLGRAQGAPLALRIGGNSTDETAYAARAAPRAAGVLQDVGPAWARALGRLHRGLGGGPLTVGLDLAHRDLAADRRLLSVAARAGAARVELGNEPDLYTSAHTFRVGRLTVHRPQERSTYGPTAYAADAARLAGDVVRKMRVRRTKSAPHPAPVVVAAGGFARPAVVRAWLAPLLARAPGAVDELTAHVYALTRCDDPRPPGVLARDLLSTAAEKQVSAAIAPYRGLRRPVRVSELNSAVCGGAPGVSDRAAAAVWAPGALATLAAAGVTEADVHTWAGAFYAPIGPDGPRPLFDGLELFARFAPAGSRLSVLPLSHAGRLRAWTATQRGVRRVLVVNSGAGSRALRLPGLGAARVQTLTAGDLTAPALRRARSRLAPGQTLRLAPRSLTLITV